jgi:flagellar hook assembly protein FlgD
MDASVPTGKYNMTWSGDDDSGQKAANGIYFISILVDGKIAASEKLVKKGK